MLHKADVQRVKTHDLPDSVNTNGPKSLRSNLITDSRVDSLSRLSQTKASEFRPPRDIAGIPVIEGYIQDTHQHVVEMEDSSELFHKNDWNALWNKFNDDRYLLIRGAISPSLIETARKKIEQGLDHSVIKTKDGNESSSKSKRKEEGMSIDVSCGSIIHGSNQYAEQERGFNKMNEQAYRETILRETFENIELDKIYHHPAVFKLLNLLAKGMAEDFDLEVVPRLLHPNASWLRVKTRGEVSPLHSDIFYFLVSHRF